MKARIFMSEHFISKKPGLEPFIVILPEEGRMLRVNSVKINGPSRVFSGAYPSPFIKTHAVRAFILCEMDDVKVLA